MCEQGHCSFSYANLSDFDGEGTKKVFVVALETKVKLVAGIGT